MNFLNHKKTTVISFSKKAGFTLIEMLVAVFVFSIIMTISVGAIFSIVSANKTSQSIKSVMDNLSSALDSMSREVRYGTVYNCGNTDPDFLLPHSCVDVSGNTVFSFVARPRPTISNPNPNGDHVIYYLKKISPTDPTGSIYKCTNSTGIDDTEHCVALTAPEVHIKNLYFYVLGAEKNELQQSQLLITISGYAQFGMNKSEFNIETMVSQRNLMCKQSMHNLEICKYPDEL